MKAEKPNPFTKGKKGAPSKPGDKKPNPFAGGNPFAKGKAPPFGKKK